MRKSEAKRKIRINAEFRSAAWLAKANEKREAGKDDSREIERAQYWLDVVNNNL